MLKPKAHRHLLYVRLETTDGRRRRDADIDPTAPITKAQAKYWAKFSEWMAAPLGSEQAIRAASELKNMPTC